MQNLSGLVVYKWDSIVKRALRPKKKVIDMLLLTADGNAHGISYSYRRYRRQLYDELGLITREIASNSLEEKRKAYENFDGDIVFIAPPQRGSNGKMIPRDEISDFFRGLPRKEGQKLVLFDVADSPTGRHFELAPLVDMYAMTYTYSDRADYEKEFIVGNKFADFASRHYNLEPTQENEYWPGLFDSRLDPEQISKLYTTHRLGSRRRMHKAYAQQGSRCITGGNREIDVHCRFNSYAGWCRAHRLHVKEVLNGLQDQCKIVATEDKVPMPQYYSELENSKILFSPFGWGEYCPKDWEAFLKGCLLMKPAVEHVEATPLSLVPNETYVPVEWDLSDVPEKVAYYLANEGERQRIIDNATREVERFYQPKNFVEITRDMLHKLGIDV